jgi:RNA polymerase sigma factor (sigma-70 family)
MSSPDSTRWTIIRGAAAGRGPDRAEFARRYASIIRSYLGVRWRDGPLHAEIDDAAQEVFVQCFRPDGALDGIDPERRGGFRAYLFGVVRNVARGVEREWRARRSRGQGAAPDPETVEAHDAPLEDVFDRVWAAAILRLAADRQARAAQGDEEAVRRIELLRLRFREDLPIREIAKRWEEDPDRLHRAYRTARGEFLDALTEVVRELHGGSAAEVEAECVRLLDHIP